MRPVARIDRFLSRATGRLGARLQGVKAPRSARFLGSPVIDMAPGSTIEIGERVSMISKSRMHPNGVSFPVSLSTRQADSRIAIGDDTGLTGVVIAARADVTIGSRVMIGPDVRMYAGVIHRTEIVERRYVAPDPRDSRNDIVIEDDVFIGAWVMVMAGVRIGRGSVIGAHSVVTRDIPPMTVAAGVPARPLRSIEPTDTHA